MLGPDMSILPHHCAFRHIAITVNESMSLELHILVSLRHNYAFRTMESYI